MTAPRPGASPGTSCASPTGSLPSSSREDSAQYTQAVAPRVTAVLEKGAAYYAGIAPGDEFQFVNRRSSFTSAELAEGVAGADSRDFTITIIYKVFDFSRPYYSARLDVRVLESEPADTLGGEGARSEARTTNRP